MFIYIGITAVITFATLLDTFTNIQIESFTKFDWIKLTFKSFIPSLVALKAYLDNTVNETLYNQPSQSMSQPTVSLTTQDIVQNLKPPQTDSVQPKRFPRAD